MLHARAVVALVSVCGLSSIAAAQDLYALSGYTNPSLVRMDPVTGTTLEVHAITNVEALFGGLAINASGDLYSIDGYNDGNSDRLFKIDRATGAGTVVGETRFNWNFRTLCFSPVSGVLYAATDNNLFTMNTSTGEATLVAPVTEVGGTTRLDQLTCMVIGPGGQAYITDIGDTDLFSLDLATGNATWIGSIGAFNWFDDLAFDGNGVLHGVRLNGGMYTVDTTAATVTFEFNTLIKGIAYFSDDGSCYANCDGSTAAPILNVNDFICFQAKFAAGDSYANCDGSTSVPVLNINDFICFQSNFAAGCR